MKIRCSGLKWRIRNDTWEKIRTYKKRLEQLLCVFHLHGWRGPWDCRGSKYPVHRTGSQLSKPPLPETQMSFFLFSLWSLACRSLTCSNFEHLGLHIRWLSSPQDNKRIALKSVTGVEKIWLLEMPQQFAFPYQKLEILNWKSKTPPHYLLHCAKKKKKILPKKKKKKSPQQKTLASWRNLPIPPSSSQSLKGQWGPRHTVNTRHRAWYSRLSSWNACQVWRYRRHTHVMVWIKSNLQLFPSKAAEINTVTLTHFILLSTFPNSRRIDAFKTWF